MGTEKQVTGVWAALRTPRDENGRLDEAAFVAQLDFLADRGLRQVVLNGATGEYPLVSPSELIRLLELTAARTSEFLCGVGSASIHGCLEAGRAAMAGGARGLLLPMPFFFPYSQGDLTEFCRRVARELEAPILLYNLPHFTSPLEASTVAHLAAECSNIIGIKDSGGTLDIVGALPDSACRIIGDDSVLVSALHAGVCDGVISGVANVLPGLIHGIFQKSGQVVSDNARLDEFIEHLNVFPTPWGLKLAAEHLGLGKARFSQPLSTQRQEQAAHFRDWFLGWNR